MIQCFSRDLFSGDLRDVVDHVLHFGLVKCSAYARRKVLREVHVLDELADLLLTEDATQVTDHIADGRKYKSVEMIEVVIECQLHDAARNVADVGLVIRIAFDDLFAVATAKDANRQCACSMSDLSWEINGHIAQNDSVLFRFFPLFGIGEVKVEGQGLAFLYQFV